LGLWLIAAFALSAVSNLRVLLVLGAVAPVVLWRGCGRAAGRTLVTVAPAVSIVVLASWGWLALVDHQLPAWRPYAALALRALLITFLSFSMLARVDLLAALRPFATATRLLVITLAQIHALRLLYAESRLGLQSRLLGRPGVRDVVRGAAGISGTLFTMATRNAREISEAMRSRGF
jgi:cobalt/nickel transport system permease protein